MEKQKIVLLLFRQASFLFLLLSHLLFKQSLVAYVVPQKGAENTTEHGEVNMVIECTKCNQVVRHYKE